MKRTGLLILCVFLLSVLVHGHIRKHYRTGSEMFSQLLYMPAGKYLRPVALGYDALLADFLYLWSIQYYSDPGFHPRMEYLQHTYDIITELDPRFIDAYQTGALFLFHEGRNPEAALRFLNIGIARNPAEWILPTDAGFYCWINLKDYKRAEQYFQQALAMPGAPSLLRRMLAGIQVRIGEKEAAYLMWKQIYEESEKPWRQRIASQHMKELHVLIDLDQLRKAIQLYSEKYHSNPVSLERLAAVGLISKMPTDPEGDKYVYDPVSGRVSYAQGLVLYERYQ
jgi:tetratricopeptide (TPR) repeat protein